MDICLGGDVVPFKEGSSVLISLAHLNFFFQLLHLGAAKVVHLPPSHTLQIMYNNFHFRTNIATGFRFLCLLRTFHPPFMRLLQQTSHCYLAYYPETHLTKLGRIQMMNNLEVIRRLAFEFLWNSNKTTTYTFHEITICLVIGWSSGRLTRLLRGSCQ